MSAYFNLAYAMECFELLGEQRLRMRVAFNTVVKRSFKLIKYTSVHDVSVYIGSMFCDIILDERRFLLLQSCIQSACGVKRKCGHVLSYSKDVLHIIMEYCVYFNLSTGYVRRQFLNLFQGEGCTFLFLLLPFLYLMWHECANKQFIFIFIG